MFLQYTLAVMEMICFVVCGRWHLAFDVLFSKKSIKKVEEQVQSILEVLTLVVSINK